MQGFKSNSRCVDKQDVVCIESGMLFSHKKKKKERNFAICSNMDGPGGYYAKRISQRKKKQYDITYMCNLKICNKKAADSQV